MVVWSSVEIPKVFKSVRDFKGYLKMAITTVKRLIICFSIVAAFLFIHHIFYDKNSIKAMFYMGGIFWCFYCYLNPRLLLVKNIKELDEAILDAEHHKYLWLGISIMLLSAYFGFVFR